MANLDRWIEERACLVSLDNLEGFGAELRREINQDVFGELLDLERFGFGRKRLRRRQDLARQIRLRNRTLFDRPDRLTGLAIEDVRKSLLGGLDDDGCAFPIDRYVEQHRRLRVVEVPDVVMHHLEVPHALAGLDVEGEQTRPEQVVAGAEPAEEVDRRRVGGNEDEAARRIG